MDGGRSKGALETLLKGARMGMMEGSACDGLAPVWPAGPDGGCFELHTTHKPRIALC